MVDCLVEWSDWIAGFFAATTDEDGSDFAIAAIFLCLSKAAVAGDGWR